MSVNESRLARRLRKLGQRTLRPRVLIALGAALVLVLVFHFLVMPRVVRGRVRAALDEAGLRAATFRVTRATLWATEVQDLVLDQANRIDRVVVLYGVRDLWEREVHEIIVSGATLSADPSKWPVEVKRGAATSPTTLPKAAGLELPFNRLAVQGSTVVLADGSKIPLEATMVKGPLDFTYRVSSRESGLDLVGSIARHFNSGEAAFYATHVAGEVSNALLETYVSDAGLAISGRTGGEVKAAWDEEGVKLNAALEVTGGAVENASDAKLTIASGVLVAEAQLGSATTQPSVTVKARDVALATPDLTAQGVSGAVTLVDLSPPTSAPQQHLSAAKLTIGQTEFANGQIEFEVDANGDIIVHQTRWDFLGGQVYAKDVRVPRDGPVRFTLQAENVELRDILSTYAKGKLAGTGRLSGELPVVIDGRNITFGEGRLTSLAGGELRIRDEQTLAQVSQMAGAAVPGSPEQVKQNIAKALKDFEYDRITAKMTNEADGFITYVNIHGRGRTGARQEINYDLRIAGLDDLLRMYLDVQEALERAMPVRATTGKVETQ